MTSLPDQSNSGRYRTIVADPPWHYDRTGYSFGARHSEGGRQGKARAVPLTYETLRVDEIAALPVSIMAGKDAHLYLWTTQRYLLDAHQIALAWHFKPAKVLIWCKAPTGFPMGGTFGNACEFIVFARRGSLRAQTRIPRDWFTWPRAGWTQSDPAAKHSRKPEAFLDLVEQVSPGPYVELFARRDRLGWDTWGDQSLGTADLVKVAFDEDDHG